MGKYAITFVEEHNWLTIVSDAWSMLCNESVSRFRRFTTYERPEGQRTPLQQFLAYGRVTGYTHSFRPGVAEVHEGFNNAD